MPTYVYRCKKCEFIVEYFHSYKVKRTTCERCGEESLEKMLNNPINIRKTINKPGTKPGKIIKDTIEETKQEIKKDKEKLRSRKEQYVSLDFCCNFVVDLYISYVVYQRVVDKVQIPIIKQL